MTDAQWVEREFTGQWSVTLTGLRAEDGEAVRAALAPVLRRLHEQQAPILYHAAAGTRVTNGGDEL